MNKLQIDKQTAIISALVEGNSIRSTERMTGVHRDTITRLLTKVGNGCGVIMDQTMRNLPCKNIQVDEIWNYVGKKQGHLRPEDNPSLYGDMWTYVALDADTKLIPTYLVAGVRNRKNTHKFIHSLNARLSNRVQLSSDAMRHYVKAVEAAFGDDVDYAHIVKSYETEHIGAGRYSPPYVSRVSKKPLVGNPNEAVISTSHVERQNLTMRMSMRRFTRLTNAFSKKYENLKAAISLHFAYYNFVRVHSSLKTTPAIAAGIDNERWGLDQLIELSNRYT